MSDLEDVKAAFLAHKVETQRRWDEVTRGEFSYDEFQRLKAENEGLSARISALVDQNNYANARIAELQKRLEDRGG